MSSESLITQIDFANANYTAIIVLCVFGILLNVAMLIILVRQKQVFASVYSIYMMQIAVTDLVVCVMWIAMLAMLIDQLPSRQEVKKLFAFNPESRGHSADELEEEAESKLHVYRFMYAIYNLHSLINIFLLSVMSVERCIAVNKSLQCQRYKFRKNVICSVSAFMWLLALICTVPSMVDPNLITQSKPSEFLLETYTEGERDSVSTGVLANLETCHQPLNYARNRGSDEVTDYRNISAEQCFQFMYFFYMRHESAYVAKLTSDDAVVDYNEEDVRRGEHDNSATEAVEPLLSANNLTTGTTAEGSLYNLTTAAPVEGSVYLQAYILLFKRCVMIVNRLNSSGYLNDLCYPVMSKRAKVYQIVTTLVIGFFIPFVIIVGSNLFIAYHIGKQAKRRLQSNKRSDKRSKMTRDHQFKRANAGCGKGDGCRDNQKTRRQGVKAKKGDDSVGVESEPRNELESIAERKADWRDSAFACPHSQCDHDRPRTSSFIGFISKKCRISYSSAESFPTDHTSFCSSSGLSQSVPTFSTTDRLDLKNQAYLLESNAAASQYQIGTKRFSRQAQRESNTEAPPSEKQHNITPTLEGYDSYPVSQSETSKLTQVSDRITRQKCCGNTRMVKSINVIEKNAERQKKVSSVILLYVVVFACCWVPIKVATAVYYTEGWVGKSGHYCQQFWGWARFLSFFSVLLNPVVFAATQKKICSRICTGRCLNGCFRKMTKLMKKQPSIEDEAEDRTRSDDDVIEKQRTTRFHRRWFNHRLGKKNLSYAMIISCGRHTTELDEDIIDEENERIFTERSL